MHYTDTRVDETPMHIKSIKFKEDDNLKSVIIFVQVSKEVKVLPDSLHLSCLFLFLVLAIELSRRLGYIGGMA